MRVFVVLSIVTFLLLIASAALIEIGWYFRKDVASLVGHFSLVLASVMLVSTWVYVGVQISHWM